MFPGEFRAVDGPHLLLAIMAATILLTKADSSDSG